MRYEDQVLEFLIKPENMKFVLELEPYIPQAKAHKCKLFADQATEFFQANIPKEWSTEGYRLKRDGETLHLIEPNYNDWKYLNYYMHFGSADSNGHYLGLMGDFGKIGQDSDKCKQMIDKFDSFDCLGPYYSWFRYKYFSIPLNNIFTADEDDFGELLKVYQEEFWKFADDTWDAVAAVNDTIV